MNKEKQMWIFRYVFWVLAFINFLESTDIIDLRFDMDYIYYYTNLSNLLVFLWITYIVSKKLFNLKPIQGETTIKFSITIIIMITFLIYNTLLGNIFSLGYWHVSNVLKHFLLPILMFIDYIYYTPKKKVAFNDTYKALVFPLLYFVYAMIRGIFTHDYPYFFIDPTDIGYSGVTYYVIGILIFIWAFSYVMYKSNHLKKA